MHVSPKFQPVFVVAGPHFSQAEVEKVNRLDLPAVFVAVAAGFALESERERLIWLLLQFDWCYETEDPMNISNLKKGFIPHGYWQAAVNPAKVDLAPRQAAIAWCASAFPVALLWF